MLAQQTRPRPDIDPAYLTPYRGGHLWDARRDGTLWRLIYPSGLVGNAYNDAAATARALDHFLDRSCRTHGRCPS